jgi:hypothetical protein
MEGKTYVEAKDVTPTNAVSTQAINTSEFVSSDQVALLRAAAATSGVDEDSLAKSASVKRIENIQAYRFDFAMAHLHKKAAARAKIAAAGGAYENS